MGTCCAFSSSDRWCFMKLNKCVHKRERIISKKEHHSTVGYAHVTLHFEYKLCVRIWSVPITNHSILFITPI